MTKQYLWCLLVLPATFFELLNKKKQQMKSKKISYCKGNHNYKKEGRKEMFYLTTHSTHFYLWLYGIKHKVKDHSDY